MQRLRFDPWARKIPQRRKEQPTPVFLPGGFNGQRSLMGYSPWGRKTVDMTEGSLSLSLSHTHTHTHTELGKVLKSLRNNSSECGFESRSTSDPMTLNSFKDHLPDRSRSPGPASIKSLSHVRLFVTPWTAACLASLSITNSWSLLKLMSIELVMRSNHLILCHPLLFLPSIFLSIKVFSDESALHIRWPKYWSFSFSISPSNEYSGLLSFTMDWMDLLAVQGTLKSLLQHLNSKASVLRSAFFIIQLSYPYMTTGKTIALTR